LNNLGNLAARQGQLAEARGRFAAAVAIDPNHAYAQLNLGRALLLEGKPDQAQPHLEMSVRLHPDDPVGRELLAKAYFKLGQPAAAIPQYETLAKLVPTAPNFNNLGSALAASGRLADAVVAYQRALEIDPSLVDARNNLAQAERMLGKKLP
jgi:tetratricopeptide (TPR) repeat protein